MLLLLSDESMPHLCAAFLISLEIYLEYRQHNIERLGGSPFALWESALGTACDPQVITRTRKLREQSLVEAEESRAGGTEEAKLEFLPIFFCRREPGREAGGRTDGYRFTI